MRASARKTLRATALLLGMAGALIALRMGLEPKESPVPTVDRSMTARAQFAAAGETSRIVEPQMIGDLARADVLLVGEDHFYRETNEYLTHLLDSLGDRRITLLLEIPRNLQPAVDAYVANGVSPAFDAAVNQGDVLPLQHILQWAHQKRAKVSRVLAVDEPRGRIVMNRALLRDTRNRTMADAVTGAVAAAPGERIVIYGGQLHMTLGGRYRYDLENRTPAGALLTREFERDRVRSVMISGKGKSPAADVLRDGVYTVAAAVGKTPYAWFIDYPIFRATQARELFDYYVILGELTRIGGR